jgi:hypothetical protein
MWEMKPRMTPQKTSRLLMGPEQVTRPKTLQAICLLLLVVVVKGVVVVLGSHSS